MMVWDILKKRSIKQGRILVKAIVYTEYGPPDVLQIKEVERPVPRDDEVLIRVHETIVTATDCINRKGEPFLSRFGTGLISPKIILGTEVGGEIEAVGKDVTSFKVGDRVFGSSDISFGAHAEYICLPGDGVMALKPANITYGEAAVICDGGLTASHFLRDRADIRSGQEVLVNGASGSVGTAAVQLAKHFGAEVTGVCSTRNLELVRSLGADKVIDYTKEDFTRRGESYDIIFDTVAKSSFSRCKGSQTSSATTTSTTTSPRW